MQTTFWIQTVLECLVVGFLIWGIFHEDRLVRFESRIAAALRRRALRVVPGRKPAQAAHRRRNIAG